MAPRPRGPGASPPPTPAPQPQPCTCHRQKAGRTQAPRETTSVTPDSLSRHPHPCLCVCLVLSLCLSLHVSHSPCFSLCFCLSLHSPLPLCRDLWRSPTAWMCPTRARSTPSTSVRSARCWAITAAGCSEPAAARRACSRLPGRRRSRPCLGLSAVPRVLQPYTPRQGCLRFSSHVC